MIGIFGAPILGKIPAALCPYRPKPFSSIALKARVEIDRREEGKHVGMFSVACVALS